MLWSIAIETPFAHSQVVREHYTRDDISCGADFCPHAVCADQRAKARLSQTGAPLLVIDTNVALHQIDLLENAAVSHVVVLAVVVEEVKARNLSAYNRLKALCAHPAKEFFVFANEFHKDTYVKAEPNETPNDRNDRGEVPP